ncbi:mannose-6-phosphate isomerase, class I [Limibacter armeniacum]|uniref:mannose-6-phosphate isomerase, class I n=1 Tax=Limibacter armeniacum TaxID=466084 RepID=UPI002FE68A2E
MSQKKIYKLEGVVQHYAWGGESYIPALLEVEAEQGKKYAEYWMGAHDNAPALIGDDKQPLNKVLEADKNVLLNADVAAKFGRLPYLFKVLDVKDMLSIQVHPTKEEAEKGFALENKAGIPISASNRNYKDDNHKPEIMVALSEFWLLHGFRPENELKEILASVPEFRHLQEIFDNEGYFGLYKYVMELSQEEVNQLLKPLVERVLPLYKEGKLEKSSADYWTAKAVDSADSSDYDRGIFSIYFFNIVKVNKGEAVFQDAGVPHAYLEGQNMELMANSDNVLRGGLTPKHVDVPELLKHVTFEAVHPNIMKGEAVKSGLERIYKSPVPDFELSRIELNAGETYTHEAYSAEVLFVNEGEVTVDGSASVLLKSGEAAVVFSGENYSLSTSSDVVIYKAAVPVL